MLIWLINYFIGIIRNNIFMVILYLLRWYIKLIIVCVGIVYLGFICMLIFLLISWSLNKDNIKVVVLCNMINIFYVNL